MTSSSGADAAIEEPVQQESWPETMEQAHEWIRQLRREYRRQNAYVELLRDELHRLRPVSDIASYWHHARGMHRKPWLSRLRDAVVEMESRP